METLMTDNLTSRRKGYIRSGRVKVEPIKRSSDWLPAESDSAFMNTGAKIEYVTPRLQRSGQLIDPLGDLTVEQKDLIAKELGYKSADDLNVNKKEKENFWINRTVFIDKNGKFLELSNIGDFISYKILEVNTDYIAPSYQDRYEKGTYKFALVFDDEKAKIGNLKIDTKKSAYILFGKIDGSAQKMEDFLWIYYLTDKEKVSKRPPNNPGIDYLRGEIGRIIEEKTGVFLSLMSDEFFEDKVLIQKSINNGLIHRDGQMFTVFGEPTSKSTLEGLIGYLKDERNNNIRLSLIGKLDEINTRIVKDVKSQVKEQIIVKDDPSEEFLKRLEQIEKMSKDTLEKNNELIEKNVELVKQNEDLQNKLKELQNNDSQNKEQVKGLKKGGRPKKEEFKLPE